jgi:hypothetical protein
MTDKNIYDILATIDDEEEAEDNAMLNSEEFIIEEELVWMDKPIMKVGVVNIEGRPNIIAKALLRMGKMY